LGIAGLVFFFVVLFYQPNIHNDSENFNFSKKVFLNYALLNKFSFFSVDSLFLEFNLIYQTMYGFFFFARFIHLHFYPMVDFIIV
jgi:hypothetical protein